MSGACKVCGRPRPAGYLSTCGGSYCQESDYCSSAARAARKGKRREALLRRASEASELARRRAA